MDERLARRARNEALMRSVNERIEALDREAAGSRSTTERFEFHCECGREGPCPQILAMTLAEYEHVRAEDDRFALYPGHETPELERVVERGDGFVVVDKLPAAEPLVSDDRRGAPGR